MTFDDVPELDRIRRSSQYLAALLRREEYARWLWEARNLFRRPALTELYEELLASARAAGDFQGCLRAFRAFKQRQFLRIGGREILGLSPFAETVAQVSDIASISLQTGIQVLRERPGWWVRDDEARLWEAVRRDVRCVCMGLGKLGGRELNFVSDVDVMFIADVEGLPEDASLPGEELLSRLVQRLARLMSDPFEGDRVFNIDFRLRPGGKEGPLLPALSAATDHYLLHGAAWERQMLLKARPVAGDRSVGAAFLREVRPFVFRRFLDFQAFGELRAMRDRILREAVRPAPGFDLFDVKLGIGGIREVEFFVQCLQLTYGGRHPELDEPNTLKCIEKLGAVGLLAPETARELAEGYVFLRRLEHAAQLDQNRQTHEMPASPEARERLATALGLSGGAGELLSRLAETTKAVHRHFTDLFREEGEGEGAAPPETARAAPGAFPPEALARLYEAAEGFAPVVSEALDGVLSGLSGLQPGEEAAGVVLRLDRYLAQARRRKGLMRAFRPPAPWLPEVLSVIARSALAGGLLAHHPGLVEGLMGGAFPAFPAWSAAAGGILAPVSGYEEGLEWLRRLKNERLLQVVLADLSGRIPQIRVEHELAHLADFFVTENFARVRENLGLPSRIPLAVLGLGKLGGGEMGYLSDLDLAFVYRPEEGEPGDRIPEPVVRCIQRFMRMLSIPLSEGPGYEVDARLRPSGTYGPLVVTLSAFRAYYEREADLWERQALFRARPVAGHPGVCAHLAAAIRETLSRPNDPGAVWERLCHLRGRMERERGEDAPGALDLKLGTGGLADLEFLLQGRLLTQGDAEGARLGTREALARLPEDPRSPLTPAGLAAAWDTLRTLESRLALATNLSGAPLTPERLAAMRALGLWPPAALPRAIEDFHDVANLRKRIRRALATKCPDMPE